MWVGEAARELFADAEAMLGKIVSERWFEARGVAGFWPANSDGDDIVLWTDEARTAERARPPPFEAQQMPGPRQGQGERLPLSDFVAPLDVPCDYVGLRRLHGRPRRSRRSPLRFEAAGDDYSAILAYARTWPTAWRRPSPRRCTARSAPSFGDTPPDEPPRETWTRCSANAIAASARAARPMPGPAGPYRKGHVVRAFIDAPCDRDRAHRKLRHDMPAGLGFGALLRPPCRPASASAAHRARPGGGLCARRKGLDRGRGRTAWPDAHPRLPARSARGGGLRMRPPAFRRAGGGPLSSPIVSVWLRGLESEAWRRSNTLKHQLHFEDWKPACWRSSPPP